MRSRIPSLLVTLLVAASALYAQDGKRCTGSARECEMQIRQMLAGRRYLGVEIVELKPGLVVKSVVPDSPAQRADVRAGDRLIAVNGHPVTGVGVREFKQILSNAKDTGTLWLIVQRIGAYHKIDVRLETYTETQIDKIIAQHLQKYHVSVAEKPVR